jgi:hypothetical protein
MRYEIKVIFESDYEFNTEAFEDLKNSFEKQVKQAVEREAVINSMQAVLDKTEEQ